MIQGVSMYILMFWQNKHIHEMKSTWSNPKWEYKFKEVMIIKTKQYKHI